MAPSSLGAPSVAAAAAAGLLQAVPLQTLPKQCTANVCSVSYIGQQVCLLLFPFGLQTSCFIATPAEVGAGACIAAVAAICLSHV